MSTHYTFDDFLATLPQIRRLRRFEGIVQLLPGVRFFLPQVNDQLGSDRELAHVQGIIHSMTPAERHAPGRLIDAPRRRRIAAGAGVSARDVEEVVQQFEVLSAMLRRQVDGAA